ncbi:ComE operon protein 3 [BD1-7 clade bacterium]|uniref:ComE operon protein 3 n=1 Tax=BD1-7 clade bacterium TaxID=2029982 RepID=A0A5S9NU66_9GAMM|nr:ComE operon protein 3 [BD1-7 clade bacterium]CAA0094256.1 ComE operon protein 3 [BD1-7 clade bacterium]
MCFLVAFSLFSVVLRWQSSLFERPVLIVLTLVAAVLLICSIRWVHTYLMRQAIYVVVGACLAVSWGQWHAHDALNTRLPAAAGKVDFTARLQVESLVRDKGRYQQVTAKILQVDSIPTNKGWPNAVGQSVQLNIYHASPTSGSDPLPPAIQPCDTFEAHIRLKAPRGLANSSGFDYEAWLLHQGIKARGYSKSVLSIEAAKGFCLNQWRQGFIAFIRDKYPKAAGWLLAITIGERAYLSAAQRQQLQVTGTMHLFVISGLHISLAAAVVFGALMGLRRIGAGRLFPGDWRPVVSVVALLAAVGYAALAGFSIPVQRALVGLCVFMFSGLLGLNWGLWRRYWLAMVAVILSDPLAPLNTGFLLSFVAVFWLILSASMLQSRVGILGQKDQPETSLENAQTKPSWIHGAVRFIQLQLILFVGLLPLALQWFQGVSLISPIVNLIAIPLLSLVVVPLCLLGFMLWLLVGTDLYLLMITSVLLETFFDGLSVVQSYLRDGGFWRQPVSPHVVWLLLFLVLLMLMPSIVRQRRLALALIPFVVCFEYLSRFDAKAQTDHQDMNSEVASNAPIIDVLDVGQGLAIVIQVANKTLLYDTGAAWETGNMAEMIVLPVLYEQGIDSLDALVVSHADNDHAGGLGAILDRLPVGHIYASDIPALATSVPRNTVLPPNSACDSGVQWQWGDTTFRFHTVANSNGALSENDASCVLMLVWKDYRIMLPGDIERDAELALLKTPQALNSWMMISPHHGSNSSSTAAFLDAIDPEYVIISSGFLNRYRHPHTEVIERYSQRQIHWLNTADVGRVTVSFSAQGEPSVRAARVDRRRFWHGSDQITKPEPFAGFLPIFQ